MFRHLLGALGSGLSSIDSRCEQTLSILRFNVGFSDPNREPKPLAQEKSIEASNVSEDVRVAMILQMIGYEDEEESDGIKLMLEMLKVLLDFVRLGAAYSAFWLERGFNCQVS